MQVSITTSAYQDYAAGAKVCSFTSLNCPHHCLSMKLAVRSAKLGPLAGLISFDVQEKDIVITEKFL